MSVASLRTHTNAMLAKLIATMSATTVGDAKKPSGGGWPPGTVPGQSIFVPYAILYPLTPEFDGTLAATQDDAEITYQVTCVGSTREQAEWVADKAIVAFVGQTVTITGRSLVRAMQLSDGGGGIRRDDTVQPPLFIATPRFSLWTTP